MELCKTESETGAEKYATADDAAAGCFLIAAIFGTWHPTKSNK